MHIGYAKASLAQIVIVELTPIELFVELSYTEQNITVHIISTRVVFVCGFCR